MGQDCEILRVEFASEVIQYAKKAKTRFRGLLVSAFDKFGLAAAKQSLKIIWKECK